VRSGRLRALAVSSAGRLPAVSGCPTAEKSRAARVPDTTWYGVFAPARHPAAIVRRLHAETVKAMQSPKTRSKLEASARRHRVALARGVRRAGARGYGALRQDVKSIGLKID